MSEHVGRSIRLGVTLADVASVADVDRSTVSRVLRGDPTARVSGRTRKRITAVAAELGYVANANARSLVRRRTMTVGLLIPQIGGFVYADVVRGAGDVARALGYVLVVADTSGSGSAQEAFHSFVREGRVDGLLIASGNLTDSVERGLASGIGTCVVLNRQIRGGHPSIIEDDELGMALGVDELIAAGHSHIVCLTGPRNVDTSRRRAKGFRQSMRKHGIAVSAEDVVYAGFDEADGFQGMRTILARPVRPTAVAVGSLAEAIGAMAACRHADIAIPDDLSMVAFHDAPIAEYLTPALTTVAMPLYELGRQSMRLLHARLEGNEIPQLTTVKQPTPIVRRRSSIAPLG